MFWRPEGEAPATVKFGISSVLIGALVLGAGLPLRRASPRGRLTTLLPTLPLASRTRSRRL
jgi:hypothetical protein